MKPKIFIMGIFLAIFMLFGLISVSAEYPIWTTGQNYQIGDIVTYNGQDYICIQAHTSQAGWTPPVVPALWNTYIADFQNGDPWISGYAFSVGDITEYQDIYYRVIQAHTSQNDWTPNIVPALFEPLLYFENDKPILQKNNISIKYESTFVPSLNEMVDGFETSRSGLGYTVSVDSENYPNLNKPADIIIENTNFNSSNGTIKVYKIIEYDDEYPPNSIMEEVNVTQTLSEDGDFSFQVTSFSSYFVQIEYPNDIRDDRIQWIVSVDPDTLPYLDVWIRIRETGTSWGTWTTSTQRVSSLETDLSFWATGLDENTDYDFQVVGYHSPTSTFTYSSIWDETTKYDYNPARIYVEPADNIGDNSVRLKADLGLRGHSAADVRFSYRKVGTSTWTYTSYVEYFSSGIKTQTVTGLDSNSNYEYKAHVRYYGEDYTDGTPAYPDVETEGDDTDGTETFTTTGTSTPQLTTLSADNIDTTEARLRGRVDDLSGETSIDVYFDYKLSSASTWTSTTSTEFTGTGTLTESLTGLTTDSEYEFKICADYDTIETVCGQVRTFTPSDPSAYDLTTDLVSYWKLDDDTTTTNVIDSHGSNDGTANKNTDLLSATGILNNAFDFDGTNDHVEICSNCDLINDGAFTLSAWVKIRDIDQNGIIFSHGEVSSSSEGWFVGVENSDIRFAWKGPQQTTQFDLYSEKTYNTDDWYFVTTTYDGTDAKIYINGNLENTELNADIDTKNDPVVIGDLGRTTIPLVPFDGLIDEVGIWDRALTSDEIEILYNSGDALSYDDFISSGSTLKEEPEIYLVSGLSGLTYNSVTLEAAGYFGQYSEVDVTFEYRETGASTWVDTNTVTIEDSFTKYEWLTVTNGYVNLVYDSNDDLGFSVNIPLSGLDADTEYEYRVRLNHHVDNYIGSGTGSTDSIIDEETPQRAFTTDELPPTDVPSLSGLSSNLPLINDGSALLSVEVDASDYSSVDVYFAYKKQSDPSYTETSKTTVTGGVEGTVLIDVFGLDSETTYDYYALVDYLEADYEGSNLGSDGTEETTASTFTTGEAPDFDIQTDVVSNVITDGARLNGQVLDLGSYSSIQVYFQWKEYGDPLYIDNEIINEDVTGAGSFYYDLTNLNEDTIYQFQFCGYNTDSNITVCGIERTFTTGVTELSPPEIETLNASLITDDSARLNGIIWSIGDYVSIDTYFRYRIGGLIWLETSTSTWDNVGSPQKDISDLSPGSQIEYQLCVIYGEGEDEIDECADLVVFTTTGDGIIIPPPSEDNTEFGELFNLLTGGSSKTKTLIGFFLVIAIIFIAVQSFGAYNQNLGTLGIMVFGFIGVVIATAFSLFPIYITIILLLGMIILIVFKQIFFNNVGE